MVRRDRSAGHRHDQWRDGHLYQCHRQLVSSGGPSYSDIDQDNVADCYFLAELGDVARSSPQTISNMFINNGDGTYTVRFFHGSSEAFVTVNTELPNDHAGDGAYFAGWGYTGLVGNAYYSRQ